MGRKIFRTLLLVLPAIALGYSLTQIDVGAVLSAIQQASRPLLLAAAALSSLLILLKSLQWFCLLDLKGSLLFYRLFRPITLWLAADHLLPFRLADLTKLELLSPLAGNSRARVAGAMLGEALGGTLTFLILVLFLIALSPFAWHLQPALGVLLATVAVMTLPLIAFFRWQHRGSLPRWTRRFAWLQIFLQEIAVGATVAKGKRGLAILLAALAFKLTEGLILWTVQGAVGLSLSWPATLFVLVSIGLVLTLPVAAGNLGTFELSALGAYLLLGVDASQALACALVAHLVLALPTLCLAGLFLLTFRPRFSLSPDGSVTSL